MSENDNGPTIRLFIHGFGYGLLTTIIVSTILFIILLVSSISLSLFRIVTGMNFTTSDVISLTGVTGGLVTVLILFADKIKIFEKFKT